jgi:hypothetical protein
MLTTKSSVKGGIKPRGLGYATPLALIALLCIAIPAQAVDLIGVVVHGNAPVQQATATIRPANQSSADSVRTAVTDSQGRFVITGLTPGNYKLSCGGAEVSVHVDFGSNRAVCNQ